MTTFDMTTSTTNAGDDTLDPKWGVSSPMHDPAILARFAARPTDVLITTAPKAGTTWMQQILHQLRTGGDTDFQRIDDVVPWLELPRPGQSLAERLARFEAIRNPRVFKTHCTYEQTPGVETARILLTTRDPRDCCVSFYHHLTNLTEAAREQLGVAAPDSFDPFFERWMEFGAWFRNVRSWWPHRDRPNVLVLRYEDLKRDLEGAIETIARFLEWPLTAETKVNTLRYASFAWMKAHSDRFAHHGESGEPLFRPGTFVRKGEVGDHQGLLSAAQGERIVERARRELTPECLRFLDLD